MIIFYYYYYEWRRIYIYVHLSIITIIIALIFLFIYVFLEIFVPNHLKSNLITLTQMPNKITHNRDGRNDDKTTYNI